MKSIKILLITNSNSLEYDSMEKGFSESAQYGYDICLKDKEYIIDRLSVSLEIFDINKHLNFKDGINSLFESKNEYALIVGAAQSSYTREMLNNSRLKNIAIFSPLSTATFLLNTTIDNELDNFFQTTAYDQKRVKFLMNQLLSTHQNKKIFYYYSDESPNTYSGGLKNDLEEYLLNSPIINYEGNPIKTSSQLISKFPDKGCPVVICTGSQKALAVAKKLEERKLNNPIFTFGSNSALLNKSLIGTTVVCDLDRDIYNDFVQKHLQNLKKLTSDPSISTVLTFKIIMKAIKELQDDILNSRDIEKVRRIIIDYVNDNHFDIDTQTISFSKNGYSTINDIILLRIGGIIKPKFIPYKKSIFWNFSLMKSGIIITVLGVIYSIIKFADTIISLISNIFN
ncbi:hypothetical protein [uncultured Croceitalea sp.]|uniref:ABC transporter substrate-binding protein n=1 Tax=uncultured Croceitalea sp. TaxID=1798908 RepID=UPI00330601B5